MSSNLFLGSTNVDTLYLGTSAVTAIYLGETEVYSAGPFVGLRLSPSSISFSFDSGLTQTLKVKSSEDWTLALPNDATWLSASTLSGLSGETIVTLSTTDENTGNTRNSVISATTASFSATCSVYQYNFVENYMFNYNAKQYNSSTYSFPKTSGQTFDEDLVLNGNPISASTDYVTINGQWMGKTYSSTAENPFNRGGTSATDFTFIYKTKFNTTSDTSNVIANRGSNYNYFIRLPFSYCGGSSLVLTPSVQPSIVITTVDSSGNGIRRVYGTQESVSGSCPFGSHSNGFAFFAGGTGGGEYFNGDFYWMFLANRKLTDYEIEAVISYNENM